jgi:hypothetical protein
MDQIKNRRATGLGVLARVVAFAAVTLPAVVALSQPNKGKPYPREERNGWYCGSLQCGGTTSLGGVPRLLQRQLPGRAQLRLPRVLPVREEIGVSQLGIISHHTMPIRQSKEHIRARCGDVVYRM